MNFSKLISFLVFFNLVFLNLIFCQESESETGSISESKTISESISESKTISESISESKTISESISESKSPSKSTSISSSISETSSVSPSFSASPSFDPEIDYCRLNTTIDDCDICVATESESECLWCSEGTCRDGNFFGPKNSTDCDSWYWKQCGCIYYFSNQIKSIQFNSNQIKFNSNSNQIQFKLNFHRIKWIGIYINF
eukprot:TRINITY_DN1583_c0_g1_i5.p1 TRINITY_DN1583_c0_g1~~TRINITY_DN1583_c0_g1_i5.p1  ORF type:complete len:201 (+),score=39.54 TRINITY_DN1583_c0_g1_i5:90-692(+)